MGNILINKEKKETSGQKFVHNCKLPREAPVLSYFIPNDLRLRQWFRGTCLISSNVYHRALYVISSRALEQDRALHLTQHYYIIHPFSAFRFYWEIFMIILFATHLITTPFNILLTNKYFIPFGFWYIEFFAFITFSNIMVQFMSGYFEQSTRTIILEPKLIVKHYLKTLFLIDFIANVPIELIIFLQNDAVLARCVMLKLILNTFSFINYTEKFREKRQYPLCMYRLFQFITIYIIGMTWTTAFLAIAVHLDQGVKYTTALLWILINNVFVLTFTMGATEFILYGYELYVHFFAITFGFVMKYVIIAQIILLFKSYFSSQRKYNQLLVELREFSHFKQLPRGLRDRIFDYYNFIFQHTYYNENEIWNLMSDKLKYDINDNLYRIWFEADIFVSCTPLLMQSIVLLLKKKIYLASDVIYECNSEADYIYFLKCGTVALYDVNGKELYHVQEGSFFSDSALILETKMVNETTAIALESCEVYTLYKEDFREVIQLFPDEYRKILRILRKRRAHIKEHPNVLLSNYYEESDMGDEDEDKEKQKKAD